MTDKDKKPNDEIEKVLKQTENLNIEENKAPIPIYKVVKYCTICTFPEEYCEYSHDLLKKRKEFPILIETNNQDSQSLTNGEKSNIEEVKKNDQSKVDELKNDPKDKKHKRINDKIHIKNTKRSKKRL